MQAPLHELSNVEGLHPSTLKALLSARDGGQIKGQMESLANHGIRPVSFETPQYPRGLRLIPDPPPVLFVKGEIRPEDGRSIAVIGSRNPSAYGLAVCKTLVEGLVEEGFCIVSGMAKGMDAMAHWTALEARGRTVGVLGTGVDVVYPKSNAALFPIIPGNGFLVSEFLPGVPARPENFPRRNRLIAGLGWGVLVVEASEKSGTMITVRQALDQGREIFAVPGDIRSSVSRGTHRLIQQGAKLVMGVDDILGEFSHLNALREVDAAGVPGVPVGRAGFSGAPGREAGPDMGQPAPRYGGRAGGCHEDGGTILELIDDTGTGLDVLVHRTGLSVERICALLTELEMSGSVKRLPGNRYIRAS